MFKSGSLLWLLRYQLLLSWRSLGLKLFSKVLLCLFVIVVILLPAAGLTVFVAFSPPGTFEPLRANIREFIYLPQFYLVAKYVLGFVALIATLGSLLASLQLFDSNKDLELLIASPIDNKVIVSSELLGVGIKLAAWPASILSIVALPLLIMGVWRAIGIYVLLASLVGLSVSISSTVIYYSIDRFDLRRTKFFVRTVAGFWYLIYLATVSAFGYLQARFDLSGFDFSALTKAVDFVVWVFAGTLILNPASTLVCLGVVAASGYCAVQYISRSIVEPQSSGDRQSSKPAAKTSQVSRTFTNAIDRLTILKEWRLLWRDESAKSIAISQLFVLGYFAWQFGRSPGEFANVYVPIFTAVLIANGNGLAQGFITRMAIAEEAPELLKSCPVPSIDLKSYKLVAAWVPTMLLSLPMVGLGMWNGIAWMVPLIITGFSTVSTCLMGLWSARGMANADLFSRGKERKPDKILQMLMMVHYFLWMAFGIGVSSLNVIGAIGAAIAIACLVPTMAIAYARSHQLRKLAYF